MQFQQNPCEQLETNLEDCKFELEKFYDEKAKGLIVRSRARWHEYGEKSTKYFFKLGKKKPYKEAHKKTLFKWSHYYQLRKNIKFSFKILQKFI